MKCFTRRVSIGLLTLTGLPALLSGQVPQQQQLQQQQARAQALQAERNAQERRNVVATVNGDAITETELNINLQRLVQGQQVKEAEVDELRKQALNQLIESRLVEQYAIEQGPEVDEKEVEKVLEGARQQVRSQGMTFDQFLASRGHTRKSLEKRVEGSLAWQQYQESRATNEKLRQHFEQNKGQFPVQDFEQARPYVMQSFAAALWTETVRAASQDAEIEVVGESSPHSAQAVGPSFSTE